MKSNKAATCLLSFSVICILQFDLLSSTKICPREQSRVVANLVRSKILPALRRHHVSLDPECKFSTDRDMYAVHEDNKVIETSARWTCDFCGKAFVSEYFLDTHFGNRHPEHIQTDNALCLADVCDVFRCDIVSGAATPDYWDIALCMEDDMSDLHTQCEVLVDQCIPASLSRNVSRSIKEKVMENVCSYLTCMKFWNTPLQQEENSHLALYIVLTTMTCFGILIYNFVFYNYFYSELSESSYSYDPPLKLKSKNDKSPQSRHDRPRPRQPRPRHQL